MSEDAPLTSIVEQVRNEQGELDRTNLEQQANYTHAHVELMERNHLQAIVMASLEADIGMIVLFRDVPGGLYRMDFVPLPEIVPIRLEAYGLTETTAITIAHQALSDLSSRFPMLVAERMSDVPDDFAYSYLGIPLQHATAPDGVMVEATNFGTAKLRTEKYAA